jgi:LysR family transcriptional regulator, hydrogen peroxide-inducible genes activator
MTLTQLSYIVALADHGYFGRAAEACFVSQPTLSMQVRKLEQELGVTLFDRDVQPVRLTQRGAQVVAQARVVLAERDRLYALLEDGKGPLKGKLRVGIIPTLAPYLLPLVAPALEERHPDLVLAIEELTTDHLLDRLSAGQLDAGVVATEEDRPGLLTSPLFHEAFVAYVGGGTHIARDTPLRPSDLDMSDVWLLSEEHCLRDQVVQLCRHRGKTSRGIRFESGNLETLRHFVDRMGGVTLLPMLATHFLAVDTLRHLRRFAPPAPGRTIRLVQPPGSLKQLLVDAFADAVQASIEPALASARSGPLPGPAAIKQPG